MKILSVDTSSSICSVSILENTNPIYEKAIENTLSHSENLMPIIKEAFENTNLNLKDIDLFVACKGPGSFTGIRIGIATIKAFVDVFDKKSIGISSLEGLAYNVVGSKYVCSIIDAKNENCYCALFKFENNFYVLQDKFLSDNIQNVLENLSNYANENITFVGDGSAVYNNQIKTVFKNSKFATENQNKCSSVSVGIAAFNHINNNLNYDNTLTPMYLKKSQAERQLEEGKLK